MRIVIGHFVGMYGGLWTIIQRHPEPSARPRGMGTYANSNHRSSSQEGSGIHRCCIDIINLQEEKRRATHAEQFSVQMITHLCTGIVPVAVEAVRVVYKTDDIT